MLFVAVIVVVVVVVFVVVVVVVLVPVDYDDGTLKTHMSSIEKIQPSKDITLLSPSIGGKIFLNSHTTR